MDSTTAVNDQENDARKLSLMNVTECFCKIGGEFYPEDIVNFNYGNKVYNEVIKEIKNFNKDCNDLPDYIKPYLNHRTFKSC